VVHQIDIQGRRTEVLKDRDYLAVGYVWLTDEIRQADNPRTLAHGIGQEYAAVRSHCRFEGYLGGATVCFRE
jgi:hypothetical protein